MRVLFTTGHPAQIHNFRLVMKELEKSGTEVFWLATQKDISKHLLDYYGIKYHLLKKPGKSFFSKLITLIRNTGFSLVFLRNNKIDIVVSRFSPYLSLASFFLRKHHIALSDTETAYSYDKFFGRFVTSVLTSNSYKKQLKKNQIRFNANIELFYLHPNRFKPIPKQEVYNMLKIGNNREYIIMRFVSWDSYHDKGLSGFTNENKLYAVKEFSKFARVYISSETELPSDLEPYRTKIPIESMHNALAYATLFFGESATMASESAVLGTPAIYLDKAGRGYTDEEEEYGLVFNFKNDRESQLKAIEKGVELLKEQKLKEKFLFKRDIFLSQKIDPTAFLVWLIKNNPASTKIMKENPGFQYNFK